MINILMTAEIFLGSMENDNTVPRSHIASGRITPSVDNVPVSFEEAEVFTR